MMQHFSQIPSPGKRQIDLHNRTPRTCDYCSELESPTLEMRTLVADDEWIHVCENCVEEIGGL